MAKTATIGGGDDARVFVGEDKTISLEVLDADDIPVNITGFTLLLDVRLTDTAAAPALLSISGSVSGTYSATRSANTQRASFTLTDTQTGTLSARQYRYSIKRTDDGSETVIAVGPFIVERATQT